MHSDRKAEALRETGKKKNSTETGLEPANLWYRKPTRYHCATRPIIEKRRILRDLQLTSPATGDTQDV